VDEGACLAVKNIGKPCAGEPQARFDEGGLMNDQAGRHVVVACDEASIKVLAMLGKSAPYSTPFSPETAPIKPEKLLGSRRFADDNSDLFTTYNVVQENIIKGGLHGTVYDPETRTTRKMTTRPVRSLDRDIKLNQALWVLTEKMAEFKQKMSSPEALAA
jgi:hypothetical protein